MYCIFLLLSVLFNIYLLFTIYDLLFTITNANININSDNNKYFKLDLESYT